MDVIDQIVDRLSAFDNLYDIIRIVDPLHKNIVSFGDSSSCSFDETCFTYWNKEGQCKNCVSMRAYLENDIFTKLEYREDKVFIIIASPIIVDNRCYIIELLKDLTNGNHITQQGKQAEYIKKLVVEMNGRRITDRISGVYNESYLMERLPVDIWESINNNNSISVIAVDLDLFSKVNQQYGYKFGEEILKEAAHIILEHISSARDWIARYGGDKFILVLNKQDLHQSYTMAETIREAIRNTSFSYKDSEVNITASLSVCQITDENMDTNKLLQYLKDGMHKAKVQGRDNTVVIEI